MKISFKVVQENHVFARKIEFCCPKMAAAVLGKQSLSMISADSMCYIKDMGKLEESIREEVEQMTLFMGTQSINRCPWCGEEIKSVLEPK